MTVIAGNVTIAMLVVGAIQYLLPLGSPFIKVIVSLIFIFAFNYIAFKGMKTSAVMLITFAFITIGTLLALIVPGLFKFQLSNFIPFFVFPASSIFLAIFLVAETFFGWETATFLAEETKDSRRVMPKALIWGTVVIALICLAFVVTSLGVISWETFGRSVTPLSDLGILHYGVKGGDVFTILVYLAIIGSVAGWIVSAPRLLLAMAQDKLFFTQFAKIHEKNMTPHMAILFQTVLTTILVIVGAGSYIIMLHLLVPIILVAYSFVLISVVVLRYKKPDEERSFSVPLGKVGPILVALFMLFLIAMWLAYTPGAVQIIKLTLSLIVLGIPLYFLIEMYYDSPAILKVNEKLSYILLFFEHFLFPISLRRRIFTLLGDLRGKTVLEYGCSRGSLTRRLAARVLPGGRIYAFDIIKHNIDISASHLKGYPHVSFYHHGELRHFKTAVTFPPVDVLVSTGILSYLQEPETVLRHLGQRVKKGGKVLFVEYDRFFYFIPNISWIREENVLKKMFNDAGFDVTISRRWGLLWQYVFIYGEKV
jgi:APA family basic amino acid/polyamine antiporter